MYNLKSFESGLNILEKISKAVGMRIDYVQGGGGNTSVKLTDELMAVKASGFKLNQITPSEGFVIVNYKNIKDYYISVDLEQDVDFEKESVELAKSNVVEVEGLKVLRPSVEAGFHSIMKKYVIHTHPVYSNILCCSRQGKSLVEKIFEGKDYAFLWIPYINPGFCLTLEIKEQIEKCLNEKGIFPEVIFMENHGLITTSDDYNRALELHEDVNSLIQARLGIFGNYPELMLEKMSDTEYRSKTAYLKDYFTINTQDNSFFERLSLYPDQLVYLNSSLSKDGLKNKLDIDFVTAEISYNAGYSEALTIEETLLAYIYVVDTAKKCGLDIKAMSEKDIDFIKNWESEAYRKSLVKDMKK